MRIIIIPILFLFSVLTSCASSKEFNAKMAWEELLSTLKSDYAYMDRSADDIKNSIKRLEQGALAAKSPQKFIDIAQSFLQTLQDPHLTLSPLNNDDYIVYPTGSDMYAELRDNSAYIVDVKAQSSAYRSGIRPGMLVMSIDGVSPIAAIQDVTNLPSNQLSKDQQSYAINIALGGKRYQERRLTVLLNEELKTYKLEPSYDSINQLALGPKITYKKINDIGYIRFNNALGDTNSAIEFKDAINNLIDSSGFIIDLRNTPSGGNTGVAEPILGHFTDKKTVYQLYKTQQSGQHYADAPFQKAIVSPQLPFIDKPFVVLAGRWTGSMGEGMTIGLDALGAKAIIGAPMADLLGGIKQIQLKESDSKLSLGFERLYHVDGSFREDFEPTIIIPSADTNQEGNDVTLLKAMTILTKQ